MAKVFIDGSAGTTGLRIRERLSQRADVELITLPEEQRKDIHARADAINQSDIVFLCLPDDAARESAGLVANDHTAVIDTSTAHRTQDGWVYGFPEIGGRREQIMGAKRIANPGCHASGFISLAAPLREAGVLTADARLSAFSLTGYSGGGKKMIADYEGHLGDYSYGTVPILPEEEDENRHSQLLTGPRMYGLGQTHKHLPEMAKVCSLNYLPVFCPIVADYYAGMEVVITLFAQDISAGLTQIAEIYQEYYKTGLVRFAGNNSEDGFLSAAKMAGRDDMQIGVFGNEDRILLVSRFDNLGKGASGAAIQNMNLLMGVDEKTGLVL